MVKEDFERLHEFLLETEVLPEVSDEMRRLVEDEWPVLGIRERSDGTMLRQERLTDGSALRRVANACS
jgi:hypothetical protein